MSSLLSFMKHGCRAWQLPTLLVVSRWQEFILLIVRQYLCPTVMIKTIWLCRMVLNLYHYAVLAQHQSAQRPAHKDWEINHNQWLNWKHAHSYGESNCHALHPCFRKRAENSYLVITLPGFLVKYWCHTFLQAAFSGPKHPLSSGWVRCVVWGGKANTITWCCAASRIVSGQYDEWPSSSSKRGLTLGAYLRKWLLNHLSNNSWSIHPLPDKPYMVPGTSPIVSWGDKVLRSQMTIGGMHKPTAFTHPTIVTWDLLPDPMVHAARPLSTTTFGGLGSSGMPLSSILYTWLAWLSS